MHLKFNNSGIPVPEPVPKIVFQNFEKYTSNNIISAVIHSLLDST